MLRLRAAAFFPIVFTLAGGVADFSAALAVTAHRPVEPSAQNDYHRALARMRDMERGGGRGRPVGFLSAKEFGAFNWVGRTAAINYVCSAKARKDCGQVLSLGLTDNALVVRDHALKILLASKGVSDEVRTKAAERVVADDRNYRRGVPMWTVERAKGFLENRRPE